MKDSHMEENKWFLILKVFEVSEVFCEDTIITVHKQHIIICD